MLLMLGSNMYFFLVVVLNLKVQKWKKRMGMGFYTGIGMGWFIGTQNMDLADSIDQSERALSERALKFYKTLHIARE